MRVLYRLSYVGLTLASYPCWTWWHWTTCASHSRWASIQAFARRGPTAAWQTLAWRLRGLTPLAAGPDRAGCPGWRARRSARPAGRAKTPPRCPRNKSPAPAWPIPQSPGPANGRTSTSTKLLQPTSGVLLQARQGLQGRHVVPSKMARRPRHRPPKLDPTAPHRGISGS
jgi:hypothetical protein